MMHPSFTVDLESSNGLTIASPALGELLKAIEAFHDVLPIKSVLMKETAPGIFRYEWETHYDVPPRQWKQKIDFNDDPADPKMTFDVKDWFKISEFAAHRAIRDILVTIVPKFKVTKLEVTFK